MCDKELLLCLFLQPGSSLPYTTAKREFRSKNDRWRELSADGGRDESRKKLIPRGKISFGFRPFFHPSMCEKLPPGSRTHEDERHKHSDEVLHASDLGGSSPSLAEILPQRFIRMDRSDLVETSGANPDLMACSLPG